ncbi:MAG: metal ABC transporter ATP-binding protein [Pseudomonadota bacterium]
MSPLLQLKDVSAGYKASPVFAHLSLSIAAGQYVGLVGPTGSGKTTFLRTVLGHHAVHGGEVLLDGKPIHRATRGLIGYVPQLETVDWGFPVTVAQVIAMGLYVKRPYWPWITQDEQRSIHALAERLNIVECLHNHIHELSGGQQQRTFLARALINRPRLLVLDEPTSGVDIKTQHDVLHLLGDLHAAGLTILLTSHDLNAVAAHVPWVICFNKGVVAQGAPHDVFTEEVLTKTYGGALMVVHHGGQLMVAHAKPMHAHTKR